VDIGAVRQRPLVLRSLISRVIATKIAVDLIEIKIVGTSARRAK